MNEHTQSPKQRISKDSIKVWLLNDLLIDFIGVIILVILFYLDDWYGWKAWIGWVLYASAALYGLLLIWTVLRPFWLYKNWRYDANEEFLQMKYGALKETHCLVPMTKIQAVSTKQGPLLRRYRLFNISIDTMGSSHTIPALPEERAMALRDKIAHYAKIKEVEQ